jgi:hypothetical protein
VIRSSRFVPRLLLILPLLAGSVLSRPGTSGAAEFDADEIGNKVYIEFLGAGILYSLNYEITLSDRVGLRFGVGGLPFSGVTYLVGFAMPMVQLGRGPHRAVVGAGLGIGWIEHVAIFDSDEVFMGYGVASIGYQYQPHASGFLLRGSFTPIITDQEFAPWGGLSVGTAF